MENKKLLPHQVYSFMLIISDSCQVLGEHFCSNPHISFLNQKKTCSVCFHLAALEGTKWKADDLILCFANPQIPGQETEHIFNRKKAVKSAA